MVATAAPAVTSDAFCDCPPAAAHHGGLRRAAAGRHRAEQRAAEIGRAGGDQLAVGVDRRVGRARKGATRRDRLGEAHQRDAERARHQLLDQREVGQRERREALRNQADRRDARAPAGRRTTTRRCRRPPRPAAPANAATGAPCRSAPRRSPAATASVSSEVSGRCCTTLSDVGEEALLGDVDAQQLGHLVEHDHEADAGLEAGQHRRGNEVGDEAQAQQPRPAAASRRPARPAWPSP